MSTMPLTTQHWQESRLAHNRLLNAHLKPLPDQWPTHLHSVATIIERWGYKDRFRVRLAHSHQLLKDGQIMLARPFEIGRHSRPVDAKALKSDDIQPFIFIFTAEQGRDGQHALAYEFQVGQPSGDPTQPGLFEDIHHYVHSHHIYESLALELVLESSLPTLVEFDFTTCTLALDSRGVPKSDELGQIETAWRLDADNNSLRLCRTETYFKEPGKDHVTFTNQKSEEIEDLVYRLREEGLWSDELWKSNTGRSKCDALIVT